MTYILLIFGLIGLVIGGNMLVDGSVRLARSMGVSTLLIGLTLVGFGTSTPELVTSMIAVINKSEGIAVGNVVGSNIANILLVLGAAAVISPVRVDIKSFRRDAVFLVLSTIGLLVAVALGRVNFMMGALLTTGLVSYVVYSYISDRKHQKKKKEQDSTETDTIPFSWLSLLEAVFGIAITIFGAKLLVDNAIVLARDWGVSESVIGLTIVAVGTSLPELATSVISAIRKENDVAFGNVVGSNIYNALFILGFTALFMPIIVPVAMTRDVLIMTVATITLIGIAFWQKKFSRLIGALFLLAYTVYTISLF